MLHHVGYGDACGHVNMIHGKARVMQLPLLYDCHTFWLKCFLLIFSVLSTYSPSGLSALPPPEDKNPRTISMTSRA